MAGSHGYKFLFASVMFYLFIGFVLGLGGSDFLLEVDDIDIPEPVVVNETGNWLLDLITGGFSWVVNNLQTFFTILINPFTSYGFLAWISTAILITNIYIIVTSLIP